MAGEMTRRAMPRPPRGQAPGLRQRRHEETTPWLPPNPVRSRSTAKPVEVTVEPRELLIHTLRERLAHTGPHIGCETSHCGACTVDVDGMSVKACTVLTVQCDGATMLTVEGLEQGGVLHAIQQAFHEEHALQCGYCTPG